MHSHSQPKVPGRRVVTSKIVTYIRAFAAAKPNRMKTKYLAINTPKPPALASPYRINFLALLQCLSRSKEPLFINKPNRVIKILFSLSLNFAPNLKETYRGWSRWSQSKLIWSKWSSQSMLWWYGFAKLDSGWKGSFGFCGFCLWRWLAVVVVALGFVDFVCVCGFWRKAKQIWVCLIYGFDLCDFVVDYGWFVDEIVGEIMGDCGWFVVDCGRF